MAGFQYPAGSEAQPVTVAARGLSCASGYRLIQIFFGFNESAFHKLFSKCGVHGIVGCAIYRDRPHLFSLVATKRDVELVHRNTFIGITSLQHDSDFDYGRL
jgi:hypothetical protein